MIPSMIPFIRGRESLCESARSERYDVEYFTAGAYSIIRSMCFGKVGIVGHGPDAMPASSGGGWGR